MADSFHYSLGKFRDTILSAVAQLEFEIRHNTQQTRYEDTRSVSSYSKQYEMPVHPEPKWDQREEQYETLARKIAFLETTMTQVLAQMHAPVPSTEPILEVENPVEELLNVKPSYNTRNIVVSSIKNTPALAAAVAAAVPPSINLNESELSSIHAEEEEEEVVEEEEEEVVEEEEEEIGIEVEEFEYKGKTYQRDAENNVYLDGEPIGTWNGKRIVALPA